MTKSGIAPIANDSEEQHTILTSLGLNICRFLLLLGQVYLLDHLFKFVYLLSLSSVAVICDQVRLL